MIGFSLEGLHGGKKGPPLGLKHVALRIAGALSLVEPLEVLSRSCTAARGSTRVRVQQIRALALSVGDRVNPRMQRRAGGKRVAPRRVEPLASMHDRYDHQERANQGESTRDSKGDVFEPERATLFPTAEPGRRRREHPRRIHRVSARSHQYPSTRARAQSLDNRRALRESPAVERI